MASVMEFSAAPANVPLGRIFDALPEVEIVLDRIVPTDDSQVPYYWVCGANASDIDQLRSDSVPGVGELIETIENEALFRGDWEPGDDSLLGLISNEDVALLSAMGTRDGWHCAVRGEDRSAIASFQLTCIEEGIDLQITSVHPLLPLRREGVGLTGPQQEALVLAFQRGYFDSPRESDLTSIADELGITQQSLSARLRRGHRRLIQHTLITANNNDLF